MNLYDLANNKLWLNEYTEKQKKSDNNWNLVKQSCVV